MLSASEATDLSRCRNSRTREYRLTAQQENKALRIWSLQHGTLFAEFTYDRKEINSCA